MVLVLFSLLLQTAWASCQYTPPFKAGTTHRIVQGFNGSYSHLPPLQYGVDFEMPIGTLIYSSRAGKVSKLVINNHESGKNKSYMNKANKIVIDHGDGTYALYAHLKKDSARVKLNQQVQVGMPIARSGCTGWCEGAHLHFEIFKKDKKRKSIPFKFKTKSSCSVPKFSSQVTNEFIERR